MWLVPLAFSFAQAQTRPLTTADMGRTAALTVVGASYTVDLTTPTLDPDRLGLTTPSGPTTVGEVYDELLAIGAAVDDVMVLTLGDDGGVLVSFLEVERGPTMRTCRPLYEVRCACVYGHCYCQTVEIGLTCCPSGGTDCGDYILNPD